MEYRLLGRTGVLVSPLCLGTMMFGPWGNDDRADGIPVIHHALDAGINFVDTADVYSEEISEEIVARPSRVDATTSSSPPISSCRWRIRPTTAAVHGAGSSGRSRTRCGASGPTTSTSTRCTGLAR